jgi:hypothetical protein
MTLEGNELLSIYLLLMKNEAILDYNQQSVKNKLEKVLFKYLSIEEIESIGELYEKKVDVLGKKR